MENQSVQGASANRVKLWRKLSMGKYREREGLFLAEGVRCAEQILENRKVEVVELILSEEAATRVLPGLQDSAGAGTELIAWSVPPETFEELADTTTPQGVMAVCRIPDAADPEELASSGGLLLACDAIQDPGNLGTILRSAAWFGVSGLLIGKGSSDPWSPKVVRSTAGATGAVPLWRGELESLLPEMERLGRQIALLDGGEGARELRTVSPKSCDLVVAGNEGDGIRPVLMERGWKRVRIGGSSDGGESVESLNVAVATGIALHHFCRS
ncbi:MAG: RNA methyltransferase [Balneolaceae bacterium]